MRILILSDIHANLVALEAVLTAAPAPDAVWNLGDTVGYGPRPKECIDRVIELGMNPVLSGNHDLACVGELDLSSFNPVARLAAEWTALQLTETHQEYLRSRPPMIVHQGVTLAHGSPRAPIWEYVTTDRAATENFSYFTTSVCLIGHSHVAMHSWLAPGDSSAKISLLADGDTLDVSQGRILINPGSVGQPRDHDPRAAFAVLDLDRGLLTAYRAPYDIRATQRQMVDEKLPERLIQRLALGL